MKISNQILETLDSFGFTISQANLERKFEVQEIIDGKLFDLEVRPEDVREKLASSSKYGYLRGVFCSEKLSKSDFKLIPQCGIYYYLDGFSDSEEEWGEDKSTFKALLEVFKQKTIDSLNNCYLINKEWFSEGSDKVRPREFSLYDFYFIIFWIDKQDNSRLYISEWFSD